MIAAILLLAIAEPLVMYHSLMRERDRRQQEFAQIPQDATNSDSLPGPGR